MKNCWRKAFAVIVFIGVVLVSCNGAKTGDSTSNILASPPVTSTSTKESKFIYKLTSAPTSIGEVIIVPTPTITPSPFPTTSAQATIETFGPLCKDTQFAPETEISPDGQWITATCFRENGTLDSPLRVVSLNRLKDWKIYYRDYLKGNAGYDFRYSLFPYRWSKDGRFLYTAAWSNESGCCWLGLRYRLLVRLNLETGEQIELLNSTDYLSARAFDFTISESGRYLLFTSPTYQQYDFAILDLHGWKTRIINLDFPRYIDLTLALISPAGDKIVLPLFIQVKNNDYRTDSIGLVDLITGAQKLLITGLKQDEKYYPIRWIDANQVLLSNIPSGEPRYQQPINYWLLNINTAQITETQGP